MSEENKEDRSLHLQFSDPFRSPTELMGNEASMRRLFLVHFSCPLCGQEHACEIYLTLQAKNEDEMMEKALQTLSREDVKVNSLAPFAKEYHQQEGDSLEADSQKCRSDPLGRYQSRERLNPGRLPDRTLPNIPQMRQARCCPTSHEA